MNRHDDLTAAAVLLMVGAALPFWVSMVLAGSCLVWATRILWGEFRQKGV